MPFGIPHTTGKFHISTQYTNIIPVEKIPYNKPQQQN